MKSALFLSALLLCALPARARKCYYKNYAPTRRGDELRGSTHTCTCGRHGKWKNCQRNSNLSRSSSSSSSSSPDEAPGTIVDVAVGDGGFQTLVAAVVAAGLADALSGEGPLTVFAPTDAAFAALPDGFVQGLLADTAALTQVLLYHVVDGRVAAADVPASLDAATLQGDTILLRNRGGAVTVNRQADVVLADVDASNGVIHVIDRVLLPEGVLESLDLESEGVFPTCGSK